MATNYTRAWSNTTPANTDARKDGARDMRYIRADVDERLQLEHYNNNEQDREEADADGRHIPGEVSGLGIRTFAQCLAGTGIATFPQQGQFVTCSDKGGLWIFNETCETWLRATPQTFIYSASEPTYTTSLGTTPAAIKFNDGDSSVTLKLIKGESVLIEGHVIANASNHTSDSTAYVRFRGYRGVGETLLTGATTSYYQTSFIEDASRHVSVPIMFYDSAPVTKTSYTDTTYTIYGHRGSGISSVEVKVVLVKFTIFRTSAVE